MLFFKNPPAEGTVKSTEQKRLESFVQLMSKNSISGLIINVLRVQEGD
jgi:hypothetical protein